VGERALRIFAALSLGVLPWCAAFAILTMLGVKLVQ
jgi:hypothetical protein